MSHKKKTRDYTPPVHKKTKQKKKKVTFANEINYAIELQQQGQAKKAEQQLFAVLHKTPEHYHARFTLALLYHSQGHHKQAVSVLVSLAEEYPKDFEVYLNLGIIQRKIGLLNEAQKSLEKAITLKPTSAKAEVTLGLLLVDRQQIDQATKHFERALALQPKYHEAHAQLGLIHKVHGNIEAAATAYRNAIQLKPSYGEAHRGLAYLKSSVITDGDIKRMQQALEARQTPTQDKIQIGFALGTLYDRREQFDLAMECWQESNRLHRSSYHYDIETQQHYFQQHKTTFNQAFFEQQQNKGIEDNTPIFILGMPRSGTSLVEQILASHPDVYGAGEVDFARVFVDRSLTLTGKQFPTGFERIPKEKVQSFSRHYIDSLRQAASEPAKHITDKLPHNFLRIGVIATAMPNAKIIHCDRHPADNALSIYQHYFTAHHGYASDLSELGRYFSLYQDLMNHWHTLLPQHIYHLSYENLIKSTEEETTKLLQFCNLPFHKNCLQFHNTERIVNTPSASQVRQPIYKNAVDRWKHYESYLTPFFNSLSKCRANDPE